MAPKLKKLIKEEVIPLVDYVWIVPSTTSLKQKYYKELSTTFSFLDLNRNFRNSQEVVKATISVAKETGYDYTEGIAMPCRNSPGGCTPLFVNSFEDAVKEARKRTNEGILVIAEYSDDRDDFSDYCNAKAGEHIMAKT